MFWSATQFKAGFNEKYCTDYQYCCANQFTFARFRQSAEVKAIKLAKLAQTIIKSSQNKFRQITVISAHYQRFTLFILP